MLMFGNHWVNIDAEHMERYETMFRWNPATEHFYAAALIGEGHQIADFGCGPGHAAIEFAGYARERGEMDGPRIDAILETVKAGLANGTYLAISPQFVVTATVQAAVSSEEARSTATDRSPR